MKRGPGRFEAAVKAVEKTGTHLPEVLMANDPAVQEAGLAVCGNFRPLIYSATCDTYKMMCSLRKKIRVSPGRLGRQSRGNRGTDKAYALPKEFLRLMIDLSLPSLCDYIPAATLVRQKAICRSAPELGYPIFFDTTRYEQHDAAIVIGIDKYAGIIVTKDLLPGSAAATLTLRQNIYTDPQKPIQMNPGMYPVGEPGKDAPVLLTVNFSLTYFTLQGYLEATKIPCYMLIVDTEGLSVLTAVAAGKLNETLVRDSIKKFEVEELVSHRRLIIPGICIAIVRQDRGRNRLESACRTSRCRRYRRLPGEGVEGLKWSPSRSSRVIVRSPSKRDVRCWMRCSVPASI